MSITSYKLFLNFFLPIIPQGIRLKYVYCNIWRIFQFKNDIQFISYEQITLIVNIGKTIYIYIYILPLYRWKCATLNYTTEIS